MRVFYIVLANITLPFLIFYFVMYMRKFYYKVILKKSADHISNMNYKIAVRLIIVGFVILGAFLFYNRLKIEKENYEPVYKVKEYDFR